MNYRYLFFFSLIVLPLSALSLGLQAAEPARLVRDIQPEIDASPGFPNWLRIAGENLFYVVEGSANDRVLWRSNGTEEGTVPIHHFSNKSRVSGIDSITAFGDHLLFKVDTSNEEELWITDGTVEGTHALEACLGPCSSDVSTFHQIGERLVFPARTPEEGLELWASDGTVTGAHLLTSLLPGAASGLEIDRRAYTKLGDQLLFQARTSTDRENRTEIWTTDGTSEGTRPVFDLGDGYSHFLQGGPPDFAIIFFRPRGGEIEIWGTDGSSQGTRRLANPAQGTTPVPPNSPLGEGEFVFHLRRFDNETDSNADELWRTDGTPEGTRLIACLTDFYRGDGRPSSSFGLEPFRLGNRAFFTYNDGISGRELWVTEGTQQSTQLLLDLNPGPAHSDPSSLTLIGDQMLLVTNDPDSHINRLWVSDGTPNGTSLLLEGEPRKVIWQLQGDGNRAVFFFDANRHAELWQTDGTPEGTSPAFELPSQGRSSRPYLLIRQEDHLVFAAPGENDGRQDLWTTDGSEIGTQPRGLPTTSYSSFFQTKLVDDDLLAIGATGLFEFPSHDQAPNHLFETNSYSFAVRGDEVFFSHDSNEVGVEPWVLNRETGASRHLYNINPGFELDDDDRRVPKNSWPDSFTTFGNLVYFIAYSDSLGTEPWVTNGSRQGTRVLETEPRDQLSFSYPSGFSQVGDQLFFYGGGNFQTSGGLWVVNEQANGLRRVFTPRTGFGVTGDTASFRGRLFFVESPEDSDFGSAAREPAVLWSTDGTAEGTRQILPGSVARAAPHSLTSTGLTLFFSAMTPETGWELWATDGTPEGTRLVRDINPGPKSSNPSEFRVVKGQLLFSANDGPHGQEPWSSDGTSEGTQLLSDVEPGPRASFPQEGTSLGDEILFTARRADVGRELFAVSSASLGASCQPTDRRLCLQNGRIGVEVDWYNQRNGESGVGRAQDFSPDTGTFWFFDASNVELVVKALDARLNNESFWFFSGGLSDVTYWVTATDFVTGRTVTIHNPAGNICGQADLDSLEDREWLPTDISRFEIIRFPSQTPSLTHATAEGQACPVSSNALLLQNGRFAVEVDWRTSQGQGRSGMGTPIPATEKSGYFWFFRPENLELVVKILDGRSSNGHFWVLWGALSNVEYHLRVTDIETCEVRTYSNSEGNLCGGADTFAF